jgi:hypothetical protein
MTRGIIRFCLSKKPVQTKIKAGVLPYVLTLALVISSICMMMILMAYYNGLEISKYRTGLKLNRNATSGLNYLLASNDIEYGFPIQLDLFGDGNDSVLLSKKPWGLFEVNYVRAHQGDHRLTKIALSGKKILQLRDMAVYLSDNNVPLSLIGETEIIGNAVLPKAGVKPGYINRRSYNGSELIYGSVEQSRNRLPDLNYLLLSQINSFDQVSAYEPFLTNEPNHKKYSFDVLGTYVIEGSNLVISDSLQGNLVIKAGVVNITSTAYTENIIVIANKVTIEDGFTGSLQVFATDSISVGVNCNLLYPSGITCHSISNNGIKIGANSQVSGYVLSLGEGNLRDTALKLEKGVSVTGYVYCHKSVELEGIVNGSILCDNFKYVSGTGVNMNNLVDVRVNVKNRSIYVLAPWIFSYESDSEVVKWLN